MTLARASAWLGYTSTGGRLSLSADDMRGGVCLLGQSSSELAVLVAYSCLEAGMRTLVLDLTGFASDRISGYLRACDSSYFLYDTLKIDEENPSFHAQLIASAYSTALDLSFEQEALAGGVAQHLALEDGVASPMALAERMESEELSGNASKRLRGRLNALSTLSAVGEQGTLAKLAREGAILDFRESATPEIAELSACLVIAKLLALLWAKRAEGPDVVVVVQANRLFRGRPVFRQNMRLLSTFVSDSVAKVLASDVRYGLDDRFLDTAAVKILSSEIWNDPRKARILAPGVFAVWNSALGYEDTLIPRRVEFKPEHVTKGSAEGGEVRSDRLEILEAISTFGDSTRQSLVSYLAPGRTKESLEREIDRLLDEGLLETAGRRGRRDSSLTVLRLTAKGSEALKGGG